MINDRAARAEWCASGTAIITPITPMSLSWFESGLIDTGDQQVPFQRHLTITTATRDLQTWWVSFSDGRPFHPFILDQEFRHYCGADVYLGHMSRPAAHPEWKTVWHAHGPTKEFTSTTIYSRQAPTGNRQ